jgi:hypothetical protein
MRERLALRGFTIPEAGSGEGIDEADLPASAEIDEALVADADREG